MQAAGNSIRQQQFSGSFQAAAAVNSLCFVVWFVHAGRKEVVAAITPTTYPSLTALIPLVTVLRLNFFIYSYMRGKLFIRLVSVLPWGTVANLNGGLCSFGFISCKRGTTIYTARWKIVSWRWNNREEQKATHAGRKGLIVRNMKHDAPAVWIFQISSISANAIFSSASSNRNLNFMNI